METQIRDRLQQAIGSKVFPGGVVGVVSARGEQLLIAEGTATYEPNAAAILPNSIFDVASVTKSIPTACLALKLIELGRLRVTDKVCDFLPDLQNPHREQILIWHLLTFTILLDLEAPLSSHKHSAPGDIVKIIHTTKLRHEPGSHYAYSNAPSILLGLVVEKIYGRALPELAAELFFQPLGMYDTSFNPQDLPRVVPTEIDEERGGLLHGTVHDESAHALQKQFYPGNAGLFTTAPDLLQFLRVLLNRGTLDGHVYFKPETVELMHTNQIANLGHSTGLGWELNQPRYMGRYATAQTYGKTGFTGCLVVCDVQKGLAFTLLSNFVHPKRKPDATLINEVRKDIADIILKP